MRIRQWVGALMILGSLLLPALCWWQIDRIYDWWMRVKRHAGEVKVGKGCKCNTQKTLRILSHFATI